MHTSNFFSTWSHIRDGVEDVEEACERHSLHEYKNSSAAPNQRQFSLASRLGLLELLSNHCRLGRKVNHFLIYQFCRNGCYMIYMVSSREIIYLHPISPTPHPSFIVFLINSFLSWQISTVIFYELTARMSVCHPSG